MAFVSQTEPARYGYDFIPREYLPAGKDEYWLRNSRAPAGKLWRRLETGERDALIRNNNYCSDWDDFLVSDPFDPSLVRNSTFYGLVRIGALRKILLQHHDFCIPAGIRNSTIISCDIGDDAAVQDCAYISHYIIGDCCILSRIDEMQTTSHAKFGNGAIKDGEKEEVRIWIDVMNEAGGRAVLPFREMLPADAFLWASYRDDAPLMAALKNITQKEYGGFRGAYGVVGSHSTIKSCHIIKDVFVGEWAYIKGANKLKNISVLSSKDEPSQIGEGVEMVNGIVGYGCSAFYGAKAVRFVMGRCSSLKYGARLIHSVLGDNSTVSCCEILNNLVFPAHEQHHNNSFLIASLVQGMSNMAAGVTIGSNHNSRANDGEIRAGRGFWPGLSTTLKHSCRFASFVIIAKGDFPHELDIPLPFSLLSNNTRMDRLEVMPAYFWMHNLYALERNSWKTQMRDRRKIKKQRIETDYLAPDTAEEIIAALSLMESWMNAAGISPALRSENSADLPDEDQAIPVTGLERHSRSAVLLKPRHAWAAYREMLRYYALKTLAAYAEAQRGLSHAAFVSEMEGGSGARIVEWVNLGGQITPAFRVDDLKRRIRQGEIDSWEGIHAAYDEMAAAYDLDRARHAWEVYRYLKTKPADGDGSNHPLKKSDRFKEELETLKNLRRLIAEQVYLSREKDYRDPFRAITYRNKEEMEQVIGTASDAPFVRLMRERASLEEEKLTALAGRFFR
ncbi:MAG: DUF4954 family protein [Treponema sp.]|nr:DUF4954 family protein [Treponema sp.]